LLSSSTEISKKSCKPSLKVSESKERLATADQFAEFQVSNYDSTASCGNLNCYFESVS
jgi:hypothetical protein